MAVSVKTVNLLTFNWLNRNMSNSCSLIRTQLKNVIKYYEFSLSFYEFYRSLLLHPVVFHFLNRKKNISNINGLQWPVNFNAIFLCASYV